MIIGLTGLPRCGKDTFYLYLKEWLEKYHEPESVYHLTRVSIGDRVRAEMFGHIYDYFGGLDVFECSAEDKELIRPLLREHGICQRKRNPEYWIERISDMLSRCLKNNEVPVITDVRYLNEVKYIQAAGGIVIHLTRKDIDTEPDSPELTQCFEISDFILEIEHCHKHEDNTCNFKDTFEDYYNPNKEIFYKIKEELDIYYDK